MGIPALVGGDGRNWGIGGGDLCPIPSEHHIPVNFKPTNTGAVSDVGEEAGIMGGMYVVGTGGSWPFRSEYGSGNTNVGGIGGGYS